MEEKMSLPTAFEEKMKRLIGDEYSEYLKCFDEPRHYGLRVNTSKISTEDFLKIAPWPLEPAIRPDIRITLRGCIICRSQVR